MVVVFRVDASAEIGIGHLMRCLCLAEGLKGHGVKVVFVSKNYPGTLIDKIKQPGFPIEPIDYQTDLTRDFEITARVIRDYQADVLITDSYQLTSDYLKRIKKKVKLLFCFDDTAEIYSYADILLNQNAGITKKKYHGMVEPYTELLLGSQYILLRKEFIEKKKHPPKIGHNEHNILVTLGGADPTNYILTVLTALVEIDYLPLKIKVVSGPGYLYDLKLEDFVKKYRRVETLKDCQNMADLMLWADLAICAGGSTCWELVYLGVPILIIIMVEHQKIVAHELEKTEISINLGWFKDLKPAAIQSNLIKLLEDPARRKTMIQKGKSLIDGKGVERVVGLIFDKLKQSSVKK